MITKSIAALSCSLALVATTPQAPRDVRPAPAIGTSAIAGRVVTSDEPAAPVRRARVIVTSSNLEVTRSIITDDQGRFLLPGLPAGRYNVAAAKPGWLRASYGAVRPGRPGSAIAVAAGQATPDLVLRMTQGGVITGLVTDVEGRPARGVPVRAQEARTIGGARVVGGSVSISPGTAGETTDDRGEFRLFGLPSGEYVVSAAPHDDGEGQTRLASGGTVAYVPIYFPGTPVADDAQTVTVKAGEETSGVSFRLQLVKTARLSGRISAPSSVRPEFVSMTLSPKPGAAEPGLFQGAISALRTHARLNPDWTFSYGGVTPGTYTLAARVIERPTPTQPGSFTSITSGITTLWALTDVVVDGVDRSDLDLTMQPGMTASGTVRVQSSPGAALPDLSRVRVTFQSTIRMSGGLALAFPTATVNATGEFVVRGLVPGQYVVSASVTGNSGWTVASSIVNGRDTLDFPVEVRAGEDLTGVVVTLTDAPQRLSGLFEDASGRPASAFTVVLFPADPALRGVPRRIRTARPGVDGRYAIERVPVGDYRLAAVFDITTTEANDPQLLESLVAASIPVAIRPGARVVQNIKVAR